MWVVASVNSEDCDGQAWQYILNETKLRPEVVVIAMPSHLGVCRGQRGRVEIEISVAGVSTHAKMADVLNEAARGGFYDVVLASYNVTMADDDALEKALANASEKGIGVVGMKTLAGGGRWPRDDARDGYGDETIMKACFKWALRDERLATVIPGFTTREQLALDFSVARDLSLTAEEKRFLDDGAAKLKMGFCRQCGACLASCPRGADVPSLVRTHMYAAQYGNLLAAREALEAIEPGRGVETCRSCAACGARCAHAVDIPRRVEELRFFAA